jgi:hypothetical protein
MHVKVMKIPVQNPLRLLAACHFAIGLVAAAVARIEVDAPFDLVHILIVPLVALAASQCVLVAIWGVNSSSSLFRRVAGMAVGAVYLEAMFAAGVRGELVGTATGTIVFTAAYLLAFRARGVSVVRQATPARPEATDTQRLRFSIRGLMLLTAVVAILVAGARELRAIETLFYAPVLGLCFAAVGQVTLWAALGSEEPLWRSPAVFACAPLVGALFALGVNAHSAGWAYLILSMLLFSAVLLASLLVMRSCGFRFGKTMHD